MFRRFYVIVLVLFIVSGAGLFWQITMLSDAEEFYERFRTQGETFAVKDAEHANTRETDAESADKHEACADMEKLKGNKYPNMAAWIHIPGTSLDHPVMHGSDNQFYLDHLPDGSKNPLGSLFLDYRCDKNGSHLIIYGHNGSGGRMFGMLKNYETYDYYLAHPLVILTVPDAQYTCHIFSVRRVQADSSAYTLDFENADAFARYIKQAVSDAGYPMQMPHPDSLRIVTLSTCTGWGNERLLVQAFI